MLGQMFDSVVPEGIPAGATLVAGYVDGAYANVPQMRELFPHAFVVTITVLGKAGALVYDIENGDGTPDQGADWARTELAAGRKPTLYCSLDNWGNCELALERRHRIASSSVRWWIAHALVVGREPIERPMIPKGANALQFAVDVPHNGHAYDESVTDGRWPYPNVAPIRSGESPVAKPPPCRC